MVKDKDGGLTFLEDLPKRVVEAVTRHRLQQMNRLLIASLESAGDGIMITDLQGSILHVNRALEQMSGFTRQELMGQNPRLFLSALHPTDFYERLWQTVLARKVWQGEVTNRCKDGRLLEVSLMISPVLDLHGQLTHLVGILRDVSERKQLERQLMQAQKMQSVGTLAGGVAHEFNNLLAGISGYASLALRALELPGEVHEFLDNIVALSERAARLTRQLLTYARKSELVRAADLHGRPSDDHRGTGAADPVPGSGSGGPRREQRWSGAGGHCRYQPTPAGPGQPDPQCPDAVSASERKAAPQAKPGAEPISPPGPAILFRVRHAVLTAEQATFPQNIPPGDYVVLEIVDRGCGMAGEVLNQAIDPFFTTKEVGQGTGLGLPMVFGIVQGHQGYLAIQSTPGQGTCVSLYLPRLSEQADESSGQLIFAAEQVIEPESLAGQNILVIDDEEAILDIIRRFLEIAGHKVHCAATGQAGIDCLSQGGPVDLVILDLMMPQEDGVSTFRRLRHCAPPCLCFYVQVSLQGILCRSLWLTMLPVYSASLFE